MTIRIDPELGVGPTGPAPGLLGSTEAPVALAGPASSGPFTLEGERVAIHGSERSGGHAFWVDGVTVVANLTVDGGACGNVVAAPGSLRRELLGSAGTLIEHTLAAPALPLAACQWTHPTGGQWPGPLTLSFSILPGEEHVGYRMGTSTLRAVSRRPGGPGVLVTLHPAPEEWSVVEAPQGGLGVRARVTDPGPVSLLVAGGSEADVTRAAAAGPHLRAHEVRAASEGDPDNAEVLNTATGAIELDHAVTWATARVRAPLGRGVPPAGEDTFWMGLGALALGDGAGALAAVGALARAQAPTLKGSLGDSVPTGALATLLAARYTLLTGDAAPARDAVLGLTPEALARHRNATDATGWAVWGLALEMLADAARHAADDDEFRRLRNAATLPVLPTPGGERRTVRLPMAGQAAETPAGSLLRLLLGGAAPGAKAPPSLPPSTHLGCWAHILWGNVDEGYAAWRGLLGQGMTGQPYGRGAWDPPSAPPGRNPAAAKLLAGLAYGLLGLEPDAPSGRIRVAPAMPRVVTRFQVRQLRVGEARFTLRWARDGAVHRIHLEPTHGRVPPMVILEPSFPLSRIDAVRVDGAPAALEAWSRKGRSGVQVQLPLDGLRTVEVEGPWSPDEPPPAGRGPGAAHP